MNLTFSCCLFPVLGVKYRQFIQLQGEKMFSKKEETIVLMALLKMANGYFKDWEESKDDFCKEGVLSVLEVARKIDSGSQYTYDIGALAAKMNQ